MTLVGGPDPPILIQPVRAFMRGEPQRLNVELTVAQALKVFKGFVWSVSDPEVTAKARITWVLKL